MTKKLIPALAAVAALAACSGPEPPAPGSTDYRIERIEVDGLECLIVTDKDAIGRRGFGYMGLSCDWSPLLPPHSHLESDLWSQP